MKRSNNYMYRSSIKKTSKALIISLLIFGLMISGLVVWVGLNNWNIEESYKKTMVALGIVSEDNDKEVEVIEEPNEIPEPIENSPTENEPDENSELPEPELPKQDLPKDKGGYIEGQELPSEPTMIEGILIANKQYPLPQSYNPGESKLAKNAFGEMAAAAKLDGFDLHAFSTFRSFDYQTGLYQRYVANDGEEAADRYSARPGYSEHQTGLAFDIGEQDVTDDWASARFGETEAGKWVALNAHRFGFIMRYPEGKEAITGYMHEPWHFRYVGKELAEEIFKKNITLEEYLGL